MSKTKKRIISTFVVFTLIFTTFIVSNTLFAAQRTVESTIASLNITTDDEYFKDNGKDLFIKNFLNKLQLEPFDTVEELKEFALSDKSTWGKLSLGNISVDPTQNIGLQSKEEQSNAINKLANENNIVILLVKDDIYIVNANTEVKPDTIYTSTVGKQNWHNLRTKLSNILTDDTICIYKSMPEVKHLPVDKLVKTSPSGFRIDPISGEKSFHSGVDYSMPEGSNIYAAMDGRIKEAGALKDGCLRVIIEHKDGYTTSYLHCSQILCKVGDYVQAGDVIAKVGSTGYSTGPHLHFEYRKDGKFLVPEKFIETIPR